MGKYEKLFTALYDWALANLELVGLMMLPLLAVVIFVVLFIAVMGVLTIQYKLTGLTLNTLHIKRIELGLFAWWNDHDKGHVITASEAESLILAYASSKTIKLDIDEEAQRYIQSATVEL